MLRKGISLAIALCALIAQAIDAMAFTGLETSVSITSISGTSGHSFVYAQVTDAYNTSPAPAGNYYPSPYYSIWTPLHQYWLARGCEWLWLIYVYNRATGVQINYDPAVGVIYYHTTTTLCASGSTTPVGMLTFSDARAQLNLDLEVSLSPSQPLAGSTANLIASLSGRFRNDLNVYLSMAITDWAVDRWAADFGDGQTATINDQRGDYLSLPHVYATAGSYDPQVTAYISGHAQAAIYSRSGYPYLVTRRFTVTVSNSTLAQPARQAVKAYVAPNVRAAVAPVIDSSGLPPTTVALQHVDVLRGTLTDFYLHPEILREGYITLDGRRAGWGRTTLVGWRFLGPPTEAPPSVGTAVGIFHPANDPLRLQWNEPDVIAGSVERDYSVGVLLYLRTWYPDGYVANSRLSRTFTVTVDFAAQNG